MSPIKIQINSVEALERLIGGSSEVELDLRKSVAIELIKRHITLQALGVAHETERELNRALQQQKEAIIKDYEKRLTAPLLLQIPGADPTKAEAFRTTTQLKEEVERLYGAAAQKAVDEAMPRIMAGLDNLLKSTVESAVIRNLRATLVDKIQKALS